MGTAEGHRLAAEAALAEAQRNPVMSSEQAFRSAEVHALLAIEARLGQLVDENVTDTRPDLLARR